MVRALLPLSATACAVLALALPSSAQFNDHWASFEKTPSMISAPSPLADDDHEVDIDWGDLDGDGWTDVVVVRKEPIMEAGPRTNVLLMNETGVLTDRTSTLATASDLPGGMGFLDLTPDRDVVLADVNNDGLLDCITACDVTDGLPKSESHPRVYVNLGSAGSWLGLRHEDARVPLLLHATSGLPKPPRFNAVDAADVDLNGWVDLYLGDQDQDAGAAIILQPPADDLNDRLLVNSGGGFFVDQTALAMTPAMTDSVFCNSVALADFNQDGTPDRMKQTGLGPRTDLAYNNPLSPGSFPTLDVIYTGSSYFISTGELNGDGRIDFVISDNGDDKFVLNEATLPSGAVQWGAPQTFDFLAGGDDGFAANSVIADVDQDGWGDVLIADIDPQVENYARRMHFYHNLGGVVGGDVDLREERASASDDDWIGAPGISESDLTNVHDVAVFDIDMDGLNDILAFRRYEDVVLRGKTPSFCQADLGYGVGAPVLEVCGGDLSPGNDATLRLFNAQSNKAGVLSVSLTANPVFIPFLDATLAALPSIVLLPIATDVAGEYSQVLPGGGNPSSYVIQAVVQNEPASFSTSNAVEVQFLP